MPFAYRDFQKIQEVGKETQAEAEGRAVALSLRLVQALNRLANQANPACQPCASQSAQT
jgi:hypothetical protein